MYLRVHVESDYTVAAQTPGQHTPFWILLSLVHVRSSAWRTLDVMFRVAESLGKDVHRLNTIEHVRTYFLVLINESGRLFLIVDRHLL